MNKKVAMDHYKFKKKVLVEYVESKKYDMAESLFGRVDGYIEGLFFGGVITSEEYHEMSHEIESIWLFNDPA